MVKVERIRIHVHRLSALHRLKMCTVALITGLSGFLMKTSGASLRSVVEKPWKRTVFLT